MKRDLTTWGWGAEMQGQCDGDGNPIVALSPVQIFDNINVMLNGRHLSFDVRPWFLNNRVMVPMRAIFEELGALVEWDQQTKTVTAKKGETVVMMTIGDTSPTINGQIVTIDQPAVVWNGRTLVPLRFVAESLGVSVGWDPSTWTATITS